MTVWQALAVLAAGAFAGTINTIVGSGSLVTFPTLLAVGLPPITANVSNNVGLVLGGFSGTLGYRRELRGQRRVLMALLPCSAAGAVAGAALLLKLPERAFEAVVPALILVAMVLVALQPRIAARVAQRRAVVQADGGAVRAGGGWPGRGAVALTGVYGGYFGAAQGVLLLGLLGAVLAEDLQRINAVKNVLATTANLVAAVVFIAAAPARLDWGVAGLIGLGALVGGVIGARLARRMPPRVLRGVILAVGTAAIIGLAGEW